jgi:threonine efflux protein
MLDSLNLPVILLAALMATGSPGPATLAIAGTSMTSGRPYGLALAAGITTGSLMWSVAAALGLGALMLAHGWVLEIIRYAGAAYLLFLAYRSARSALSSQALDTTDVAAASLGQAYARGLALHVTNPKAILFFGSLYAIGIPHDATPAQLATVIAAVGLQSFVIFHGYALLFSNRLITRVYLRLRRGFEAVFALAFGFAGIKVLTTRLS